MLHLMTVQLYVYHLCHVRQLFCRQVGVHPFGACHSTFKSYCGFGLLFNALSLSHSGCAI